MKRLVFLVMMYGFSAPAWSIPLSTVGSIDNLIASAVLGNSSENTELAWVAGELGIAVESLNLTFKEDDHQPTDWQAVDGLSDTYAFELSSNPEYYLLKLGVGNSGSDTHYLFNNVDALSWAVVDFASALNGQALNFNLGRISHTSEFSASVPEPEPVVLALLSLAIFLIVYRKSKKP